MRVTLLDHDCWGNSVAIQTDGKIVVAGDIYNGLTSDLAAWRFNLDGTLDSSFGLAGMVTTDTGVEEFGRDVAIQPNGKIIVAGGIAAGYDNDFLLARYNTDGNPDTSFNLGGLVRTDILARDNYVQAITLQPDGKIIVVGGADGDFALVRYNTDGSLDASLGEYGWVITDFFGGSDGPYAVTVQWNGKILVVGDALVGVSWDFALVRYNPYGSLDLSFGIDGLVTTDIGGGYDAATSLVVQPDGKIVVAGITYNGADYDIALVRYK